MLPLPIPSRGGAGWTRTSYFGRYLHQKGHCVTIAGAFSKRSLDSLGFLTWSGIRIVNIIPSFMIYNSLALTLNILSGLIFSTGLLLWYRPDVLIISVPNGDVGFGCFIAAKMLRIPKVFFDYRDNWEDFALGLLGKGLGRRMYSILKRLMKYCYVRCDGVFVVTPVLIKQLKARGISNLYLITNGADLEIFRPYPKNIVRPKFGFRDRDFLIVHNGVIGGYYKLDTILKALKLMEQLPIKLVIIGSGCDVPRILKLIEEYGLKKVVYYYGSIHEPSRVAEILSACNVGLVPYDRHDAWHNIAGALPVKVFEYCACALPIIATASERTLLGEFILANKIGVISDPENTDDLIKNIQFLYNANKDLKEMCKRSLSLVINNYDRKKIADQLLELIE